MADKPLPEIRISPLFLRCKFAIRITRADASILLKACRTGLQAGHAYLCEVMELAVPLSSAALIRIAAEHRRLLGGGSGAAIVCFRHLKELPERAWICCLDRRKNLLVGRKRQQARVPCLIRLEGGSANRTLLHYGSRWPAGYCVLFYQDRGPISGPVRITKQPGWKTFNPPDQRSRGLKFTGPIRV